MYLTKHMVNKQNLNSQGKQKRICYKQYFFFFTKIKVIFNYYLASTTITNLLKTLTMEE